MRPNWRIALLIGLAAIAIVVVWFLPPVRQDGVYHYFADNREILGLPNFWNVVSNIPFLLVGLWGLWSSGHFVESWERNAYSVLLGGVALVAIGSSFYHLHPNDTALFWDRLPMTIVFMTLLSVTVGEHVNSQAGRVLLLPLLATGAASLMVWKLTGDLRMYGLVQFYPMIALPLILVLFPPRYTGTSGVWAMVGLYVAAKILEFSDQWIWKIAAPLSGHPWKHAAGAIGMLCYVETIRKRKTMGIPASSDSWPEVGHFTQ